MKVNEVRTNYNGVINAKTKTKANYANKQAFLANTSLVTKKSIIFSVGRAILEAEDFLIKHNPVAAIKKAIAKANYKSPEDIRIENLVKKYRLERQLRLQNQEISDLKTQKVLPLENQLKEVTAKLES